MLEQTGTQVKEQGIALSVTAAQAAQTIIDEKNLEGYGLRIYVAGSGCCGIQFGMALDNNIREVDTTFESNGVRIIVDEMSLEYLRGARVDYITDPERGAGFIVDSPAARTYEHGEGACACGGSCDCNS